MTERVVTIPITDVDMDDLRWKSRPVVISARDEADPRVGEQLRILQAAAHALGERDMPVLTDFGAGTDFELRLIGRDGTLKSRFGSPVDAETLFEIVDAMPMRREEMKD